MQQHLPFIHICNTILALLSQYACCHMSFLTVRIVGNMNQVCRSNGLSMRGCETPTETHIRKQYIWIISFFTAVLLYQVNHLLVCYGYSKNGRVYLFVWSVLSTRAGGGGVARAVGVWWASCKATGVRQNDLLPVLYWQALLPRYPVETFGAWWISPY